MTNTDGLPTFPTTPRARTALRDLFDLAAEYEKAVFLPGQAVDNLIGAIRVIAEQVEVAANPPRVVSPMPVGVYQRQARTHALAVEDELLDMTDGTFQVVAYEVYDHEEAVHDVSEPTARVYDVDPGSTLGVWFIGPRDLVESHVMNNYAQFTEQFAVGTDAS